MSRERAIRASARGHVQGVGFREATRRRGAGARPERLGAQRATTAAVAVHAEGPADALDALERSCATDRAARGARSRARATRRVEGHEQFAIRGVSAGRVRRAGARRDRAPLRPAPRGRRRDALVGGAPGARRWTPPSSAWRCRSRITGCAHNDFEGASGAGGVIVWDRGAYEQGGRVPWPEALERGHAVFVLHGQKLRGGFALQRTRPGREAPVAADQAPRRRGPSRLGRRHRTAGFGAQRAHAGGAHRGPLGAAAAAHAGARTAPDGLSADAEDVSKS